MARFLSTAGLGLLLLGIAVAGSGCQGPEGSGQKTPATAASEPSPVLTPTSADILTGAPTSMPTQRQSPTPLRPVRSVVSESYEPCGPAIIPYSGRLHEHFLHWSGDGSHLVFSLDDTVRALDIERAVVRQVADIDSDYQRSDGPNRYRFLYGFHADVSSDGSKIVYATCEYDSYEIATYNLVTSERKRVTNNNHFDNYPAWSPDGTRIAFISNLGDSHYRPESTGIYVSSDEDDIDIRSIPIPMNGDGAALYPPVWSPDNESLAFIVNEGGYASLGLVVYTVRLDRLKVTRIGRTTALPTWSPDSEELAFAAFDSGNTVIYAVRPDGTEMRRVWESEPVGSYQTVSQVSWSPDGSELLFVSDETCVVGSDGDGSRRCESVPSEYAGVRPAAWSPDGSRIAVYRPGGGIVTVSRDGTDLRILMESDVDGRLHALNPPLSETPTDLSPCSEGVVVPDPDGNPGLVRDCETLLVVRDKLVGHAELRWYENTYIDKWKGVTVGGSPPRIRELAFRKLSLTGILPPELGSLPKLTLLDLRENYLSGVIPPELGSLAELEVLLLNGNSLSGEIPPELGKLARLRVLDLSKNFLSGGMPPKLGELTTLQSLNLSDNYLSGSIPPELSDIFRLNELDLSGNELSGNIPPELGGLMNLVGLNLSYNRLSGSIPPELSDIFRLNELDLSGNELSGNIPPELGGLVNLVGLNLSYNRLSGSIPPEMGRLIGLMVLDLSFNELSGSIPPELGGLSSLESLNVYANNLSGCIAAEIPGIVLQSGLKRCEPGEAADP